MCDDAPETLQEALTRWDGKSRSALRDLVEDWVEDWAEEDGYLEDLVVFTADPALSDAASWLLKDAMEQGAELPDLSPALRAASDSDSWQTRLHLLQMLPGLDLSGALRGPAQGLVFSALSAKQAMVRAWAYAGADQLARDHADLRLRVMQLLQRARAEDSAAAVQARLRQCRY